MAESYIKLRATWNDIERDANEGLSEYYFIKYCKAVNPNIKEDELGLYEVMIRHNEIGNRTIERNSPYTISSLEKVLSKFVKKYEKEQELLKEDEEYPDI